MPRKTRSATKAHASSDHDTAQRAWIPPKKTEKKPKSTSKPQTRQVTKAHEQQEQVHNEVERWQAEKLAIKQVNACLLKSERSRLIRKIGRLQHTVRRLRSMQHQVVTVTVDKADCASQTEPVPQAPTNTTTTTSTTIQETKYAPPPSQTSAASTVEWWHPGHTQTTGHWSCCSREVLLIENGCC